MVSIIRIRQIRKAVCNKFKPNIILAENYTEVLVIHTQRDLRIRNVRLHPNLIWDLVCIQVSNTN
jgi:hypothetical protein